MKRIITFFDEKLFEKKISSSGLAIFRITFFLNLFFELVHVFNYRALYSAEIIFDESWFAPLLVVWMMSLIFIVLGLYTKIATIINYGLCVLVFSSFEDFEYHMHYVYVGMSFISIFLPISNVLSLDSRFRKIKAGNTVPAICYYLPVLLGISFVYFDSIFYKFKSDIWLGGLGLWYPASITYTSGYYRSDFADSLLNYKHFLLFTGYLTLCFELFFPFLVYFKRFRLWLFIIGILLHVGIAIMFPIPFFGIGACCIYLLIVPVSFWDKLFKINTSSRSTSYSKFAKIGIVSFSLLAFVLQINVTLNTLALKPIFRRVTSKFGVRKKAENLSDKIIEFSQKTFGITKHAVFMDGHFDGYNHVFSVYYIDEKGNEVNLPLVDDEGIPGKYLTGALWINWNFRVNQPNFDLSKFKEGVVRYIEFWANENNISLNSAKFIFKVKYIESLEKKWSYNALEKAKNVPYTNAGELNYKNGIKVFNFTEQTQLIK